MKQCSAVVKMSSAEPLRAHKSATQTLNTYCLLLNNGQWINLQARRKDASSSRHSEVTAVLHHDLTIHVCPRSLGPRVPPEAEEVFLPMLPPQMELKNIKTMLILSLSPQNFCPIAR